MSSKRVLVLGANGFVGSHVMRALGRNSSLMTNGLVRNNQKVGADRVSAIGDFQRVRDWSEYLDGYEIVIDAAALAHRVQGREVSFEEFQSNNADVALRVAQACRESEVSLYLFVSSAGVLGEEGEYLECSEPAPVSTYAQVKLFAEQRLQACMQGSSTKLVILRPPLMFGAGVKGNMARLLRLAKTRLPLPLGALDDPRSLLGVSNMASAISFVVEHSESIDSMTCTVEQEYSPAVSDLMVDMRRVCSNRAPVFRVPTALISAGASVLGRSADWSKISGKLVYKSQRLRDLGWKPEYRAAHDLHRMLALRG